MNSKGLLKLPYDSRDYSHHEEFGTLGAAQLPTKDFTVYDAFDYTIKWGDTLSGIASRFGCSMDQLVSINGIANPNKIVSGKTLHIPQKSRPILNQLDLDFCTAFTAVELQYLIFGMQFDPLWQMAKTKQITGSFGSYGASLRDSAMSVVKFGSLQGKYAPYVHDSSNGSKPRDFLANWANYPKDLDKMALKYKDLSFFNVDGPYDIFDNIRSTLYTHLQQRQGVTFGLEWHFEWNNVPGGIIPKVMPTSQGEGHDMAIIGQKMIGDTMYLVFQQSWGETSGDNGLFYFPREIVNQAYMQGYGAFIFSRFSGSGFSGSTFLGSIMAMIKSLFQ